MVSQKRSEYGFYGHQALNVPRATRSTRKWDSRRKNGEEIITCAFDLLATVADKLLLERNVSRTQSNTITSAWNADSASVLEPNGDKERHCKEKTIKLETFGHNHDHNLKDFPLTKNDAQSRIDVKVVSKDDDDNSSGCTHPSTAFTSHRTQPLPRTVDQRIRKLLAPKYWKTSPRVKDEQVSTTRGESKPICRIGKTCYNRQRSKRNYPFKKRRYFSSISNYGIGVGDGSLSSSFEKGINGEAGQYTSFRSRDSQVKLRIKSFRVPELFIEIPETATVGSLKRRVMEAVTALLGGGLRVGLLHQGKKVKDDNKTLLQTGISHDSHINTLGFALEPNSSQAPPPPPLCNDDTHYALPFVAPEPLNRYLPSSPAGHLGTSVDVSPDLAMTNLITSVESDHDSAPSPPTDMSIDKISTDSMTIVSVPSLSMLVPVNSKSMRLDAAQRRIRRPFSVSEVEALVESVEKLGTGRWRDVKMRAFDTAKHRTYVDLKDKWKTLVHTARISPQQRRGEPVPQQLLDRVLIAHSYWTQQQPSPDQHHLKNQHDTHLPSPLI